MKTLNEQYQLIKEGKGHKGVFLTEAKRQFPNYIRNAATFEEAALILKQREIINENVTDTSISTTIGVQKESFELAFNNFLTEAKDPQVKAKEVKAKKLKSQEEPEKAEAKKTSKQVEEDLDHNYDNKDDKNPDNLIFDQIMMGYYAELKDPKNSEKTMQQLKDIVFKNLAKDSIYYTKNAQFGVKDLGYSVDHPGLGEPKEAKGKYKASGYGDLNESKLRKVISQIIREEMEEAYQMPSVNTSNSKGAGGKRFIPKQLPFPVNVRKRFGDHMVYNPGNGTFYVSDILYNNLVKGYANQPAIKKLIMDIPPMVKQLLNKPENYDSTVELPKPYKTYHPFKAPVDKAKADQFNKDKTKQYWSEGDFLFPNLNVMEEGISTLKESVEKDLADINKEAEHEVLQTKLDKIDALIDHRRSKLGKLDEDEDMKALTDKKKVKELEKDIKKLEVARKKIEKMLHKTKGKKKEVIDEMEGEEPSPELLKVLSQADEMYDGGLDIDTILVKFNPRMRSDIERHLRMGHEGTDND
jgi:hypothetical protein